VAREERRAALEQRKEALALRKEERELRKQEREFAHPVRAWTMKRSEQLGEKIVGEGVGTLQKAPKEVGREARRVIQKTRVVRIRSGFTEGEQRGRVRLPVFQPGVLSLGERIASDFGGKPPVDVLPQKPQTEFFTNKSAELFLGNKPVDVGLGNNGKKKKELRYY
jgi:hypothetical protein